MSNDAALANAQNESEGTSEEGAQTSTPSLSEDAKKIIAGLNKSGSKSAAVIKEVAEALGLDPKDLNAEKVKALIAPAKEAEGKVKTSVQENRAALADFIGEPEYADILPTLRHLADSGVKPTKELADTLVASTAPSSSGPRSTGGGSGRPTEADKTKADEDLLKNTNLWGESLR